MISFYAIYIYTAACNLKTGRYDHNSWESAQNVRGAREVVGEFEDERVRLRTQVERALGRAARAQEREQRRLDREAGR